MAWKNPRQIDLEEDIRSRYGGMLTLADVAREIGVTDRKAAQHFLRDVAAYEINGRKRYRVPDVARKILDAEV